MLAPIIIRICSPADATILKPACITYRARYYAPDIGRFESVSLYNIDDLNEQISRNKEKRSDEIPKARQIVAEFTNNFSKWYDSLNLVPVISQLT